MTTESIIKLNQIIGKALVETANEAYWKRIESMKARPFYEVVEAIRNKESQNKANGYFVTDAIRYFDERLEKEDEENWLEIEVEANDEWLEAIEQFRW